MIDSQYLEIVKKNRDKREKEKKMMIFKRTLGWLIVICAVIGFYVAISLSMPEIYSFPVGGALGWMIPMSRWLVTPFVIGMFLSCFVVLISFAFFMAWCFNGSWKEVWEGGPFNLK